MFCPKCKTLMFPDKETNELVCRRCDHREPIKKGEGKIIEKAESKEDILEVAEGTETTPKTKVECPECGNLEAFYHIRQTRAADEAETKFYRCTKCGHTWRDYN